MAYTYRTVKGSPLTHEEYDANFAEVDTQYNYIVSNIDSAVAAKDAAVVAQGLAEDAELGAQTAAGAALGYRNEAEGFRNDAAISADEAEAAAALSEGAWFADTVTDLIALEGDVDGRALMLAGYHTKGDGGGGQFYWDATSTDTADDGITFAVTGVVTGRWKRVFTDVYVDYFGTYGDADEVTPTDDTAALQAAIDYAYTNGGNIVFTKSYSVTGIKVYPNTYSVWLTGSKLVMRADGICLRTVNELGLTVPTGRSDNPRLVNPVVDMNGYNGFGILIECCEAAIVDNPIVRNVGSGSYSYNDGTGVAVYPTTGIRVKGIDSVYGCYYTVLNAPILKNPVGSIGKSGIDAGTSIGYTGQRANTTIINHPVVVRFTTGIYISMAGDCKIHDPEVSLCTWGVYIGRGDGSRPVQRTYITNPYTEGCTAGVTCSTDSTNTIIIGWGSNSGSTDALVDNGMFTSVYSNLGEVGSYSRFHGNTVRGIESIRAKTAYSGSMRVAFANNTVRAHNLGTDGVQFVSASSGFNAKFAPDNDNDTRLGAGVQRWSEIYAANATINTSDERHKCEIYNIPDDVLDAWGKVNFKKFKWRSAVDEKGDKARIHTGVIAQDIIRAFSSAGLDPFEWGLVCYDENDSGTSGSGIYGIRATECLFMEAAYVRRAIERLG